MSWVQDVSWERTAVKPLCSICSNVITKGAGRYPNLSDGEYVGIHHRNMQTFRRSSELPCMICSAVWAECASNTRYNIIMDERHGYVTRWKMEDYDDFTSSSIKYVNAVVLTIVIPRNEIRVNQGVGTVKDYLPMCSFVMVPSEGAYIQAPWSWLSFSYCTVQMSGSTLFLTHQQGRRDPQLHLRSPSVGLIIARSITRNVKKVRNPSSGIPLDSSMWLQTLNTMFPVLGQLQAPQPPTIQ